MHILKQAEQWPFRVAAQRPPYWDQTLRWFHVSPHKLSPGAMLEPGKGRSPYSDNFSTMSSEAGDIRSDHVYVTNGQDVGRWLHDMLSTRGKQQPQGLQTPMFVYEVGLNEDDLQPEGFQGSEGYTAPQALVADLVGRGHWKPPENDWSEGKYVPEPLNPGDYEVNWEGW